MQRYCGNLVTGMTGATGGDSIEPQADPVTQSPRQTHPSCDAQRHARRGSIKLLQYAIERRQQDVGIPSPEGQRRTDL